MPVRYPSLNFLVEWALDAGTQVPEEYMPFNRGKDALISEAYDFFPELRGQPYNVALYAFLLQVWEQQHPGGGD